MCKQRCTVLSVSHAQLDIMRYGTLYYLCVNVHCFECPR